MNSLHDDLRGALGDNPGNDCKACLYLASDAPDDQKDEVRWGLSSKIGQERLSKIFAKHGVPIGWRVIKRHRAHQEDA